MDRNDRKRRQDAWDAPLTEAQRWEAYERAKGLPWYTFAAWVAEEYGLKVSKSALYAWAAHMRRQEGAHRIERAIASRQELKGLADKAALDAQTADAYMALANDAILSGDPEKAAKIVAAAVAINGASLRVQEQRLQAERLKIQEDTAKLAREKFEAAEKRNREAAAVASNDTLSEAERIAQLRALFGV